MPSRGSFNNNRGASGTHRFQRGGRGNFVNRGSFNNNRGDFSQRGSFRGGQRGAGNWSSPSVSNRFQNNDEKSEVIETTNNKNSRFGTFSRGGRNSFNCELNNFTPMDEFSVKNDQNSFLENHENDRKRITRFSDNVSATSSGETFATNTTTKISSGKFFLLFNF